MIQVKDIHIDRRSKVDIKEQLYQNFISIILSERRSKKYNYLPQVDTLLKTTPLEKKTIDEVYHRLIQESWVIKRKDMYEISKTSFYSDFFTALKSIDQAILDIGKKPSISFILEDKKPFKNQMFSTSDIPNFDSLYIRRLIYADDFPVVVYDNYIHDRLDVGDWSREEPLYVYLNKKGKTLKLYKRYIETKAADQEVSKLLNIPLKTPILVMYGAAYDDNQLVQMSVGYVHPNFVVTLDKQTP